MQQIRQRTSTMMEPMTYTQFGVISGRTLAIFLPAAIMAKLEIFRSIFPEHLRTEMLHQQDCPGVGSRRMTELQWRYATDPYLPPQRPLHFLPAEAPESAIWKGSFRNKEA